MKPLDPRLIARIGPARRYVIVTAVLGFLTAFTILVQALLVSRMLAPVLAPSPLVADGIAHLAKRDAVGPAAIRKDAANEASQGKQPLRGFHCARAWCGGVRASSSIVCASTKRMRSQNVKASLVSPTS